MSDLPNFQPDELDDLRTDIEGMRAKPERFMELRGTALQLVDDLAGAYQRLDVAYERLDGLMEPQEGSALRAPVDVVLDVLPIDPDSGMAIVGWTSPVDSPSSAKWGAPEVLAERVIQALVREGLLPAPTPVADPLAEFGRRRAAELNARGADVCPVCLAPRDAGVCRWCPAAAVGTAGGGQPNASDLGSFETQEGDTE